MLVTSFGAVTAPTNKASKGADGQIKIVSKFQHTTPPSESLCLNFRPIIDFAINRNFTLPCDVQTGNELSSNHVAVGFSFEDRNLQIDILEAFSVDWQFFYMCLKSWTKVQGLFPYQRCKVFYSSFQRLPPQSVQRRCEFRQRVVHFY